MAAACSEPAHLHRKPKCNLYGTDTSVSVQSIKFHYLLVLPAEQRTDLMLDVLVWSHCEHLLALNRAAAEASRRLMFE